MIIYVHQVTLGISMVALTYIGFLVGRFSKIGHLRNED